MEGWKKVINTVHKKGSKIFLQIVHGGRACLTLTTRGLKTWAPSAIAIRDKIPKY
jgi:N-ethylmaleimide reductase